MIVIFFQIVFIDLVLAADNAIIIWMVASQFKDEIRKRRESEKSFDDKTNLGARSGTAFDPAAAFLGASIITNVSRPKYDISYAVRNKIRLSGFELDLSTGEYNNKQLSTLSSSTFGTTTTLNTQQDRIAYLV